MSMADQGALDRYADQLYGKFVWTGEDGNGGVNGHSVANLLWNGPAALRGEVLRSIWDTGVNDNANHGESPASLVLGTMAWRVVDLVDAVARLEQNDANIGNAIAALQGVLQAKLVRAKDDPSGAIYVVTQNSFKHITGAALNAGADLGLWGGWDRVVTLAPEAVAALAEQFGGKLYVEPPVAKAVTPPDAAATKAPPVVTPVKP
jgi:hypothetical protein